MIKCWLHRRTISRCADENAVLPPSTISHLAECPACRRQHELESQIIRRLTARAVRQQEPPPFLQGKIMAQIGRESASRVRANSGLFAQSRLVFAAFAAACLVLTAILFWPAHSSPSGSQVATDHLPSQPARASSAAWPDAAQLTKWVANPDQPLETEMNAVLHDARGAVTAIADNFFPEKLRQTLLASTQNR